MCVHKGGWEAGDEYPTSAGLISHSAGCRKGVKTRLILFFQDSRNLPRTFLYSNSAYFPSSFLHYFRLQKAVAAYRPLSPFPPTRLSESDA